MNSRINKRIGLFICSLLLFGSSQIMAQDSAWKAPEGADQLVNPLANDAKAAEKGKRIYWQVCALCHGRTGVGNGPDGKNLKVKPADHTSKAVQSQSDGAIFWKISKGRDEMPSYNEVFSKTQRWQLVAYIRTLQKNN